MGVIHFIVFVPFFGADGELIGARFADEFEQMARIEAAVDELASEIIEERGIFWRVAGANVIQRLDNADAGEIAPQAIGVT